MDSTPCRTSDSELSITIVSIPSTITSGLSLCHRQMNNYWSRRRNSQMRCQENPVKKRLTWCEESVADGVVSMTPAYPASRLRSSKKTRCRFVPSSKKQNSCLKSAVKGRPLPLGRIDPKSRSRWGLIFVEERYRLKSAKPPRPVSQSKVVATASICSSQRLNLRLEFGILITILWVTARHRLFTPYKVLKHSGLTQRISCARPSESLRLSVNICINLCNSIYFNRICR